MIATINQYWPIVLTVLGGIAAVTKYYLDWLKIRELRYKLDEAEAKKKSESSLIVRPSSEEINKYSVKEFLGNSKSSSILSIAFVGVISFSIYQSNLAVVESKQANINQHLLAERNAEKLRYEINTLRSRLEECLNLNYLEIEANALGSEKGREFWVNASIDDFQSLIDAKKQHLLFGGKLPKVIEFSSLDRYHYRAEFYLEDVQLSIEAKYLLVHGPQKAWFVIESMKSHNKAN